VSIPGSLRDLLRRALLLAVMVAYAIPGLAAASGGLCVSGNGSLMPACDGSLADRLAGRSHREDRRDDAGCRCCETHSAPSRGGCCGGSLPEGDSHREPGCIDVPAPDGPSAPADHPSAAVPAPALALEALVPAHFAFAVGPADVPSPAAGPPPWRLAAGGCLFLRV
jgi:hypothetical protein